MTNHHAVIAAAHLGYDASAAPAKQVRGRLPPDVWYLIFQLLAVENRQDLFNICLTSQEFYFLATPALYRTVVFAAPCAPLIDNGARGRNRASRSALDLLFSRLSDDNCDVPRIYVHEVVLSHLDTRDLSTLWELINRLPNVRNVILEGSVNLTLGVVEGLSAHPRRPTLELLDQDGTTMVSTALPQARSLQAVVDLGWGINEAPNRRLLSLQRLLFSCPNLRSLSLTTADQHSGCALRHLMFPTISNFKLTGEEIFPPIEDLTLNGYQIRHMEWPHWRDHFPWNGLSSLTLGPQPDLHTLGLMTGCAKSIRHLKLAAYSDEEQIRPGDIDRFLLSFDTLISLEIRGLFYSVHAVANHPNLTTVRLHAFELTPGQRAELGIRSQRRTLSVQDLRELDSHCPYIEELELDCNRHGGQWPGEILTLLASRFDRLRHLSIHLELGVSNLNIPLAPVLSATTAQAIGREFLAMRGSGRLQGLTLKTGEPLRRFPGGDPLHRRWEQVHAATFEIQPGQIAGQPVHVVHVEREVLEGRRHLSEIDSSNPVDLRVRVQAAIDGPGTGMQEDEAKTGPGRGRHGGLEIHRVARETRMIPV